MRFFLLVALAAAGYGSIWKVNAGDVGFVERKNSNSRIIGGELAEPQSAPYIVSVKKVLPNLSRKHVCAGSIIGPKTVLTAAHCLWKVVRPIEVDAGMQELEAHEPHATRQLVNVSSFVKHEFYDGSVGPYDIGLIFLDKSLKIDNKTVGVIRLPEANSIHKGNAFVYGWGATKNGRYYDFARRLQTAIVQILPLDRCRKLVFAGIYYNNVCTGPLEGGVGPCMGDSGGPLVQKNDKEELELVGITSWGQKPCAPKGKPSVFTQVSAYVDWVRKNDINHSLP